MKVYLNDTISESAYNRLKKHVEIVDNYEHPEELDAIIVRQQYCTREVISKAVKCRIIQQHGTGLDRIDVEAAGEYGIPVYNTPGLNAQSVAEYAVMMMLSLSKKARSIDRKVHAGLIHSFGMPETVGVEMYGKRLGLVGYGHIAKIVAGIAREGFRMEISCFSEHMTRAEAEKEKIRQVGSLEELFETNDYISLHNLLTDRTHHMINDKVLEHAKPGLIFVNTARGGLVDESALYRALVSGRLGAAGLDVFEHEPPDCSNPLLGLDNVIAGMHVAGSTYDALERNGKAVVDNVFKALGIDG